MGFQETYSSGGGGGNSVGAGKVSVGADGMVGRFELPVVA